MKNLDMNLGLNSVYEVEVNLKVNESIYDKIRYNQPDKVSELFKKILGNKLTTKEYVYAFYFTDGFILKGYSEISNGGVNFSLIDTKIVAQHSVLMLSSSVIIVHNHPSGILKPSNQDLKIYEKLKKGLKFLDIELIDFLIVSFNGYWSISQEED